MLRPEPSSREATTPAARRAEVLTRVRRHLPVDAAKPDVAALETIRYEDRAAKFAELLAAVGGACARFPDEASAAAHVAGLPVVAEAARIDSDVPSVLAPRGGPAPAVRPHDLADVDVACVRGEIAVAENAAVWVGQTPGRHRAVYFLAQHVVLVVEVASLVDTLHEAYRLLAGRLGPEPSPSFGVWISGPSKTADIEQSLVIGAHGARSLTVLLIG